VRAVGVNVASWVWHSTVCFLWDMRYRLSMPIPVHYHLVPGAVKPLNAHADDGCYDIVATTDPEITTLPDGSINVRYDTGLRIALPLGWHTLIFPRSSITKYGLVLGNGVGYADNGFRGTFRVSFKYVGDKPFTLDRAGLPKKGERIAQITFVYSPKTRFFKADSELQLPVSHRGENGWGSTGKT